MTSHGVPMDFDAAPTQQIADKIRGFDQIPDIMTMEIPPIEYLVDGMISRKTITLWTGPDGTAKTFLAQKMGIAVAMGGGFLGRRCQRAPVLYLDYENPSFAVRERLDLMAGGPIGDLKVWGTWLEQQPPQIGNELLLTIAKNTKPLIIVDPFRYAHGAEENDSTEMMGVMQQLRYCAAAGGAVVVLHHPAKTEGSTGRGSTAIKGAVDVAFLQEMSEETGLITLACTKNRFGERHSVTIRPDYDEGTFTVTDSPQFAKRAGDLESLRRVIEESPGLTQNAIYKKSGMKKSRLVALLKAGKDSSWEERQQGNSLLYFPIVPMTGNNSGTTGTGQGSGGCSSVPSPYRREQGTIPPLRPQPSVPGTVPQKPNGKTLESCPDCGGFAIYRDAAGRTICQTCEDV
ncbi:MAG: AAA family ATPase [Terriglobales bacterium]